MTDGITRCPDCEHRWAPEAPPAHCPACGVVLEPAEPELPPDLLAAVSRRFVRMRDPRLWQQFLTRHASAILSGLVCRDCSGLMDMDDPPTEARPRRCSVCRIMGATHPWPAESAKPARRGRRIPTTRFQFPVQEARYG